jgi:hypothetical protein
MEKFYLKRLNFEINFFWIVQTTLDEKITKTKVVDLKLTTISLEIIYSLKFIFEVLNFLKN